MNVQGVWTWLILLLSVGQWACVDNTTSSSQSPPNNPTQSRSQNQAQATLTGPEAFAQTLYPLLTEYCNNCHTSLALVPPFIADSDPALAYAQTIDNQVVDLADPSNSLVVIKLRTESHECWSLCDDDANALQTAIEQWAAAIDDTGANGQALYQQDCAGCHGDVGQGTDAGVALTRALTVAELTTLIDQTMPSENPTACTGSCASKIAQYIFDNFIITDLPALITDPVFGLPTGVQQIQTICDRIQATGDDNVINDAFCGLTPPTITSLRELQAALGLEFTNPDATGRHNNGKGGNPGFVLTGHSSSLVARFTSAINPRAIIFTPPNGQSPIPGFVVMGFVRGDQFAEIIASDRNTNVLSFFLVRFKQACNANDSCTPGDLLTPAIESNWTEYTLYDQQDLANTSIDCLQCHQPDGPGTRSILRMQELRNPWTHFFRNNRFGGIALLLDYRTAHGRDEEYAGIPGSLIAASDPARLENLVRDNGFSHQPNEFDTRHIQKEVNQTLGQPFDNDVPGTSSTWQILYEANLRGEAIGVPYHDVKVTDSTKLIEMTLAYRAVRKGTQALNTLPDIRDVFLDAALPDIGFKVKAGLEGQNIITQACTQCHHIKLNQSITRARFNVALDQMSDTQGSVLTGTDRDAEIGVAIDRLQFPTADVRKMPPEQFRTLEPAEIQRVIEYLCTQITTPISQCP